MRSALAVLVCADLTVFPLAGCGASLGDDSINSTHSDASTVDGKTYRDAGIDAPVDARPCMGGTMAMTAPDGSCFVFISTTSTYVEGKTACAALAPGGHLAFLKTAALDTAAEAFIGNVDTWIGGNDLVTEMAFAWDDGTPFTFTNWHTGEPNNGGPNATYQEDCAIIAGSRTGKQWDDRPCDATEVPTSGKFASLCQY